MKALNNFIKMVPVYLHKKKTKEYPRLLYSLYSTLKPKIRLFFSKIRRCKISIRQTANQP